MYDEFDSGLGLAIQSTKYIYLRGFQQERLKFIHTHTHTHRLRI